MEPTKLLVLLVLPTLLSSACATGRPSGQGYFAKARAPLGPERTGAEAEADVQRRYDAALNGCKEVLQGLEGQATRLTYTRIILATIGAVAGGVLVPYYSVYASAHKGIIAALGGVSGVTNAAQATLAQGALTPEAQLGARAQVVADVKAAEKEYSKARRAADVDAMMAAIDEMMAACVAYDLQANPIAP
jgi:hypothetical protein